MGLQVEVKCSLCGGKNSFPEDSYAFKCRFCSSVLHVTGTGEILSYRLSPRIKTERVGAELKKALLKKGLKSVGVKSAPRLLWAPFWRLRAKVFCWVFTRRTERREPKKELQFKSLDLTFPAARGVDTGVDSLGLRTAALPLKIFNPNQASTFAEVLPVDMGRDEALRRGRGFSKMGFDYGSFDVEFSELKIVNLIMSVVYLPVYTVEVATDGGEGSLFMDGVSLRVTRFDRDDGVPEIPVPEEEKETGFTATMGLIPFRCRNCGWDLPFRPYSRIHVCEGCGRGWREEGEKFHRVSYEVVKIPRGEKPDVFMPFWRLKVEIITEGGPARNVGQFRELFPSMYVPRSKAPPDSTLYFYVPAFKVKSLMAFNRLAAHLSLDQPSLHLEPKGDLRGKRLAGAFLGVAEASQMARIVFLDFVPPLSRRLREMARTSKVKVLSGSLVYFPYREERYHMRDLATGRAAPKGTLVL